MQGSAAYRPRAECGPPKHFTRFTSFYCHPARNLFSNDSHLVAKTFLGDLRHQFVQKKSEFLAKTVFLFWSSPSIRPNKGLSFWRRPFFGLRHHLNFWIKPFSSGPLEWWSPQEPCSTKCGSLVQTVIDPQPSNTFSRAMPQLSVSQYAYSHCTRVLNWQSVINCKLNICQFSLKKTTNKQMFHRI